MQFFRVSTAAALALVLFVSFVPVSPVWADPPTDSGTVLVTGSVAPKGASITTSLAISPTQTTFSQDQTAEFTLNYSSANPGSFPFILQAEWGKGQIAGASEASVDTASYVIGSATKAYGDVAPVINTTQRTITWSIPSLPGNSGTHSVSFKLKTTDSYTGPLLVNFPVKLKVLSPSGASDRLLEVPFKYQPVSVGVSPTVSSTLALQITPAPIPNTFDSIVIRSTGRTSARVLVTTTLPSKIFLNVGTTPTNLTRRFESIQPNLEHLLYLDNLAVATPYYFQVVLSDGNGTTTSDIFTFTTAAQTAAAATRKPTAVTFSQQRTVMYSGPTSVENQDEIKPIFVVRNSVIDLNLAIPNDQELKTVEVVIRPSNILGFSTETANADDFQSTTTVMTKISSSVFVGKLRMPVTPGMYQVVSRIEDLYGNLSEEEIGSVRVTQPFTITNHLTGEPLLGAEVNLFIYNQQTKLYETVSNVTTSVPNPAFADETGAVVLTLAPARYLAKITLPGFKDQSVEFEVGSQTDTDFPQVQLEPISNLISRQYDYGLRLFQKEWARWMSQFEDLVRYPRLYPVVNFIQLSITFFLVVCLSFKPAFNLLLSQHAKKLATELKVVEFTIYTLIRYYFEFVLMVNLFFGYFFWQIFSGWQGFGFALIAVFNLVLWLRCLWLMQPARYVRP